MFHPETKAGNKANFNSMEESNPYTETLQNIQKAMDFAKIKPEYRSFEQYAESNEMLRKELDSFEQTLDRLHQNIEKTEKRLSDNQFLITQLLPLKDLNVNLDELFSFRFVTFRFGWLPRTSYDKTVVYGLPKNVCFVPTTIEKNTVWGFYFCPRTLRDKTDAYFSSLFFEREKISDMAHGVPGDIIQKLKEDTEKAKQELSAFYSEYEKIIAQHRENILKAYSHYQFLSEAFSMRKYAVRDNHLFYLYGWVPARHEKSFIEGFRDIEEVTVVAQDANRDKSLRPPTKIHNIWGVNFFEQFVNMYGTPCYNELDPTLLVALSYTLFFGVMFGDVGQGIVLCLLGLLAYFKLKMPLGKIMTVIGLSSTLFGFVYGSVFGNEEIIKGIGFHVLEGNNTIFTLLCAAGVGILLIVGAMILNIINGIKQKNFQKIFFDTNSLAGLMLFGGNVTALLLTFLAGKHIYSPLFCIFFIALPLLAIFFRQPLGKLCAGEADWKPEKFGYPLVYKFLHLYF